MSDELIVGPSRSTSVATSALTRESLRCERMSARLRELRWSIAGIDRVIGEGILAAADAPRSALLAEQALAGAARAAEHALVRSEALARGLALLAHRYERAEESASTMAQEVAGRTAWLLGQLLPVLALAFLPGVVATGLIGLGVLTRLDEEQRARLFTRLGGWLRENDAVLSDPGVVNLVRLTVMSVDDFAGGAAHLPADVVHLLGDEGSGLLGVDTSAAAIGALAGSAGLLRETPVTVRLASVRVGDPAATGIRDRLERIPSSPDQVRIDRYTAPDGTERFEVYLAGTAELSTGAGTEPWDMTSNVTAMGGGSAGSLRAAIDAMDRAGIDASTPVTITGYSQGGLLAAQLAASGEYRVEGLVTFGAPAGQVAVPQEIPYLAVEHTDDLVPALGGSFESSEPLLVQRRAVDGGDPASDRVLPAHLLANYGETAALVDESGDPRIRELLNRLRYGGAPVASTVYRAERVIEDPNG